MPEGLLAAGKCCPVHKCPPPCAPCSRWSVLNLPKVRTWILPSGEVTVLGSALHGAGGTRKWAGAWRRQELTPVKEVLEALAGLGG